jgi:carboxylate-amine ligase
VPRILEHGASYQRQRRVAASAGGELRPVVEALLEEMRVGLPS